MVSDITGVGKNDMSIDKQHGKYFFICDGDECHDHLETNESNFTQALEVLKEEGWRSERQRGNEWKHYCPDC